MNLLFNLLIFSLPFGMVSRINIYPNSFIYIHDIFAFAIFVLFAYKLINKKVVIHDKKVFQYLALFVVVGFVSLLLNFKYLTTQSFTVATLYIVRYMFYASIIFAIPPTFRNLNIKLITSGIIFIAFGYLQYFYYPDLKNLYYAGWDEHLYRLFSTMLDPNYAGMFIVLIFILIFGNLLHYLEKKESNNTLVFVFLSLASLIAIYLTYSRSALIALVVGISTLLIIKKRVKFVVPAVALLVAFIFIFANTKMEGMNPWRIASAGARVESIKEAVYIIERNPVLGVGFNAYRYALQRYGLRTSLVSNADSGTDNSYLFVLATTGIVGFGVFMMFIFQTIRAVTRNISQNDVISVVALPSLLALLVGTMFLNSLFYTLIMAWVFIVIGATLSKKQ